MDSRPIPSLLAHPAVGALLAAHDHYSGPPPLAVFDCDGTVLEGDIGEAMFYRQIERMDFRRPPASVWRDHPRRGELERLYDALMKEDPRARRAHDAFAPFAEMLLARYVDQIAAGDVAKACADIVRLLAGHTLGEVRALADATLREELSAPAGTRRLGMRDVPRGVRYLRETAELLFALAARRFEIWAVSGSNAWSVEPVFRRFGVPPGRVIGIALEADGEVLTDSAREPIPVREGKVGALRRRTDRAPVLVASDSRNDIPLLLMSAGLKVRINSRHRDTAEFFRSAGITPDDSWVVLETPHAEE